MTGCGKSIKAPQEAIAIGADDGSRIGKRQELLYREKGLLIVKCSPEHSWRFCGSPVSEKIVAEYWIPYCRECLIKAGYLW